MTNGFVKKNSFPDVENLFTFSKMSCEKRRSAKSLISES